MKHEKNQIRWASLAVVAAALFASVAVAVQDEAGEAEAVEATEAASGQSVITSRAVPSGQVVRPYNLLEDLTDEQEAELKAARGEYLQKVREAEEAWHEASLAVLTDEQKAALDDLVEQRRTEAAERRAQRRAERAEAAEEGN